MIPKHLLGGFFCFFVFLTNSQEALNEVFEQ